MKKLLFLFICLLFAIPSQAQYGGGSGTSDDPYLIYTPEQMNAIGADPNDWDKHFKLMADIDLSSYTGDSFNIIGNSMTEFTGVFDGNDHVISNFTYSSTGTWDIGLFGCVAGSDAAIKDLGLIDPNVDAGKGYCVGSLVGYLYGETISSCYAKGGSISGYRYVGGLVGGNQRGTIRNCYASCSVSGTRWIGGLVGTNNAGNISNCYATGNVTASFSNVGGLLGHNTSGDISESFATGNVMGGIGEHNQGGLIGQSGRGAILDCYATGDVSGGINVGGLVGFTFSSEGTISNCYSIGYVSGVEDVGGLIGDNFNVVANSFWDVNTSGLDTSDGGTGKTTVEMQTKSTFTDAGWDFDTPVWTIDDGNDYPRLWWENHIPIADAGPNQIVEAQGPWGVKVILNASASTDADSTPGTNDDIVYFDWYKLDPCDPNFEDFLGTGEIIDCNLPLGQHIIILEVTDKAGASDTSEVTIVVQDTTPPAIHSLSASPSTLWPPNHKMVEVTVTVDAEDICDSEPLCQIVNVTSNEPINSLGDGNTEPDWQITGELTVRLRAERAGRGIGRVYTVHITCTDASGNTATATVQVTVPHDRGKQKK